MRRATILIFSFLISCLSLVAQTTDTTSLTILSGTGYDLTNAGRFGVVIGTTVNQGQSLLLKDLNFSSGSYLPVPYYRFSARCGNTGTQTTTSWVTYVNGGSNGYPANFFVGATYTAYRYTTGAILGSGTITASSANTSTVMTLTLSNAMTAACTSGNREDIDDYIVVNLLSGQQGILTPLQIYNSQTVDSSATYSTDAPQGAQQSIVLQNGKSFNTLPERAIGNLLHTSGSSFNVVYKIINGSYTAPIWGKCVSVGCSLALNVSRISGGATTTTFLNTSVNPSTSTWTQYTNSFTGTESLSTPPNTNLQYTVTCTGTCKVWGPSVIEGTNLTGGNPTAYTDNVVYKLQQIHPSYLRFMAPPVWCSQASDLTKPNYLRGYCSMAPGNITLFNVSVGYNDQLELANFIGADAQLTMGKASSVADMNWMMDFLGGTNCSDGSGAQDRCNQGQTTSWNSVFAASGHHISLALGNEPWNTAVGANGLLLEGGSGAIYGAVVNPLVTAFKTSTYYNSSVDRVVYNGQVNGGGNGGVAKNGLANSTGTCAASPGGSNCPDYIEVAPYGFNEWANSTNTYQDQTAEVANYNLPFIQPTSINDYQSNHGGNGNGFAQAYDQLIWGANASVYEYNMSPQDTTFAPTQLQSAQANDSVGAALAIAQHMTLLRSLSHYGGPIHEFAFNDSIASGNNDSSNTVFGAWDSQMLLPCGPGIINTCADYDAPVSIAMRLMNNAIGNNKSVLTTTMSGVPTYNYAGGQGGSIAANSAVPEVTWITYTDSANHFTKIGFNTSSSSQVVNFAGAAAPLAGTSVTYSIFGGTTNSVTDNCDNINLTTQVTQTCVVQMPTPTTSTGLNSITMQPKSMYTMTYTLGGTTPTAATPVATPGAGAYTSAQSVILTSSTTGNSIYYCFSCTPTTSSTLYSGPIPISSTSTLDAIAVASGYLNSAVGTFAYTINLPATAGPTITPAGGSYTAPQTITMTDSTTGAVIYYTTNGSTPTTGSMVYSGPFTQATSGTIKAIALAPGHTISGVTSNAYTITLTIIQTIAGDGKTQADGNIFSN